MMVSWRKWVDAPEKCVFCCTDKLEILIRIKFKT